MTEQISFFDIDVEEKEDELLNAFHEQDKVRIKKVDDLVNPDVETEAYLQIHGGKKGVIKQVHDSSSPSYLVEHGKGEAWLKADELVYLG